MPIVLSCECGKKLKVKDELAGKKCACPGCGAKLVIPAASSEEITAAPKKPVAMTKSVAAKTRPAPPPDDDADDDDEAPPPSRKGAGKGPKRKSKKQPVLWPWIAGGSVLLAVIIGVAIWLIVKKSDKPADKTPVATDTKPKSDPGPSATPTVWVPAKDLDLVPGDGMVFACVKVGEWWESPEGKKIVQQLAPLMPAEKIQEGLGIPPEMIERVCVVVGNPSPFPTQCVIFTTKSPVDRANVLSHLVPNSQNQSHGGRQYHVSGPVAVHFVNERFFVQGPLQGLRTLLERPQAAKKPGPLDAAAGLADSHHAVLVMNFESPLIKQQINGMIAQMGQAGKAGMVPRDMALALDVAEDIKLEGSLTYADAATATNAAKSFEGDLKQAQAALVALPFLAPPELKGLAGAAAPLASSLLKSAAIKQADAKVNVTMQTEKGLLAKQTEGLIAGIVQAQTGAVAASEMNNLKQLALAVHNQLAANQGIFPPAAIYDPAGKPLLSWRVAILPYIEQEALYREFHLNEPWDSPHNIALVSKMPKTYASPSVMGDKPGTTHFRVFVGPQTVFTGVNKGVRLTDITDGTSNTLLIAEAAEAVEWTKPDELPYDPQKPLPKLGTQPDGFRVAFADGTVRLLKRTVDEMTIRALITRAGGEPVTLPPD